MHFRLGAFGFLPVRELGEEGGTGGLNGVHDVIVGLRWIQQNIHHYGGDPTRVSLFGTSTGASLTCYLAASPLAAGLFDSAVMASGPCSGFKAILPASVGRRYAQLFRQMLVHTVPNMTEADVDLDYMRSLPVDTILSAWRYLQIHLDLREKPVMFHDANLAFMDGWVLSKRPTSYFAEGKVNTQVAIIGTTSLDGTIFLEAGHTYPSWAAPGKTTWLLSGGKRVSDVTPQVPTYRVPKASEYEEQVLHWTNYTFLPFPQIDVEAVAARIVELYPLASSATDNETYAQFLQLAADGTFVCPAMFVSQAMTEAGVEVHRYNFTAGTYPEDLLVRGAMNASLPISLTVVEPPDSTDLAGHQSEMYLITGALNGRGGPLVHSLAQTMTSYLASMHPPRNSMNAFWEAWDPEGTLETQPILQFGLPYIQKLQIGMPHAERCTFWNELTDSLFDIADVQTMALEAASSRR